MAFEDGISGRVRLALRVAVRDYLLADDNVTAVDFGLPEHEGALAEDERAIRVHVRQKLPLGVLEAAGMVAVSPRIREFQTDVLEGTYRPHLWWGTAPVKATADPRLGRADPLRGGVSISEGRHVAAGTLGTRVVDRSTGVEMILSNWHVLVADWTGRSGQSIYQPGRLDGAVATDAVARLTRDAMSSNLDAAVATLTGSRAIVNDQLGLGPITGVMLASHALQVVKSGRTTGVTHGQITGLSGVVKIGYSGVQRLIRQVVTIDPVAGGEVSRPGDSGSVWLENANRGAVGLHFAGSDAPERALAIDFASVLAALDVELEPEPLAGGDGQAPSISDVTLASVRRAVAAYA
jgi:endonuclease G, mitochondrial